LEGKETLQTGSTKIPCTFMSATWKSNLSQFGCWSTRDFLVNVSEAKSKAKSCAMMWILHNDNEFFKSSRFTKCFSWLKFLWGEKSKSCPNSFQVFFVFIVIEGVVKD